MKWKPNLDQPIQQLERILAELEQQQPMNYTISNVAFLYDAKLRILFDDYLALLPESERVMQIKEQRQWLIARKAKVREGYMEFEGGTLASFSAGQVSIRVTKKRIATIETRIAAAILNPKAAAL